MVDMNHDNESLMIKEEMVVRDMSDSVEAPNTLDDIKESELISEFSLNQIGTVQIVIWVTGTPHYGVTVCPLSIL